MASFPSIDADYGLVKQSAPLSRKIRFADGYEQRILFGLNSHQNPRTYEVRFKNRSEADCDTIEDFLNARAEDQASFEWTPPDESSSSRFVCERWNKTLTYSERATISASFRQVFEP